MEQNLVDAEVIDKLGGGRQLSSQLSNVSKLDLNEKTVYSWKQQGIPDKWRIAVAKLLIEKKIDFPSNFLPPGVDLSFFSKNSYSPKLLEIINSNIVEPKKLDPDILKYFHRKMLLLRRFEEKVGQLYGLGKIGGFCHLYIGQEAVVTGVEKAISKTDAVITGYRCHAHMLSRGAKPLDIFLELLGKKGGVSKGKGGSMHMFDPKNNFWGGHGIVGAQVPIGVGLAFSFKYKGNNNLSVTYFGDGAANQGQVYESYNMASLWKLPVIFCIENNQYGMGTSIKKASAGEDLSRHGESFGIPGIEVDGMNPIKVYESSRQAVEWVKSGNGPIILEMKTYRYRGHSMSDPAKYRTREEVQKIREEKDPIDDIKSLLIKNKIYLESEIKELDDNIRKDINVDSERALEAEFPSRENLFEDVLVLKE